MHSDLRIIDESYEEKISHSYFGGFKYLIQEYRLTSGYTITKKKQHKTCSYLDSKTIKLCFSPLNCVIRLALLLEWKFSLTFSVRRAGK